METWATLLKKNPEREFDVGEMMVWTLLQDSLGDQNIWRTLWCQPQSSGSPTAFVLGWFGV